MTINLKPKDQYPYGPNIHFAYIVESRKLQYLHPDFSWIVPVHHENLLQELTSQIHPDDWADAVSAYQKALAGNLHGFITLKLNTPLGKRWLQITPFFVSMQSSDIVLGSLTEITDDVLNRESIARYADKKNSILHMLAHDLRGPLNIAKSVTKIVDREMSEPGLQRKTAYITGILQQAIDLITDLVAREFLETTEVVLVKKRVDIVEKLYAYIEECKRSEEIAQRTFHLKSTNNQIFLQVDEAKFMQIINNLISNALKFTNPGGRIIIELTEEENQVRFSVSDNGIGIAENHLKTIFEKFTPARRKGLNGEPSLGLGLSIVETIIGWHGGTIWCESEEGIRSTFHFTIPKN